MYVQCMILNKTYGGFFFYKSVANIDHKEFIYKLWQLFFAQNITEILKLQIEGQREHWNRHASPFPRASW